jgi:hypothetical protein
MKDPRVYQRHIDKALKIVNKERYAREKLWVSNSSRRREKIDEMDYCYRLITYLFKEYNRLMDQTRIV